MKNWLLILLFLFPGYVFCQDTTKEKPSERWRNYYVPKTLLRIGLGYHKAFYSELGVTRRAIHGDPGSLINFGTAYYGALELTPVLGKNPENVYGLKVGGEITSQALMIGLETKYQTDFNNKVDVVITPKIGIGGGNFTGATSSSLFLCYGYNISLQDDPFERIGTHQFSLSINPIVLSYLLNKKNYSKKLYK